MGIVFRQNLILILFIASIFLLNSGKEDSNKVEKDEKEVVETVDVKAEAEERFEYTKDSLLATASKEIKELEGVISKDIDSELEANNDYIVDARIGFKAAYA